MGIRTPTLCICQTLIINKSFSINLSEVLQTILQKFCIHTKTISKMLWTLSGKLFAVEMILVSFFDDYIYLWGNRIVHNDEYDIDDN